MRAGAILLIGVAAAAPASAASRHHHATTHHATTSHHHDKTAKHAKPATHHADATPKGTLSVPAGGIKLFCGPGKGPLLVRKMTQGSGTTVTVICR